MSTSCPSSSQLKAFALGTLSADSLEEVAQHLEQCGDCEGFLEQLDDVTDALVEELGEIGRSTTQRIEVPSAIISSAREVQANGEITNQIALDPGRRYARKLREGTCRLGRFELQAELGDGSFGYVFRAHDMELDRTVALKIQRAGSFASDEDVRRFLREARSAAQLQHPGIVSLFECGQTEDGVCFLVEQYVAGETLESQIERDSLTATESARLVAEVAETLQYAHDHGVVHRDIKPSNVIIDEHGHPHIADFGLAKRMAGDLTMTSDGRVMGTPAYMSPEQARGDSNDVDARSDLYSLGVIFYELLTGGRPFQGNRRQLLLQVLEDEPRPLRQLNESVPRDLETICLKAMSKSPSRRYPTTRDFAADLRRYLAGEPILARPAGLVERSWRWCRRYPIAASLLAFVTLGSTISFGYLAYLTDYFVRETALDSVRLEADMLERIHNYYSENIVRRLDQTKVRVTHEYQTRDDAIPLPATFLIDAGEHISRGKSGMVVRLYSDYPWRKHRQRKDSFERTAISVLQQKVNDGAADLSYHEFMEMDGRPVVRYARAQIMQQSCVDCHSSEESPRQNWAKGDLAGVLAITHPIGRDVERTRAGLGGAFFFVGGVGTLLVGWAFTIMLTERFRSIKR